MEESSLQAQRGNRRAWDLTAQAREQHLGALSCKENPPAGVIPQALGGWGSRLAGLLLTAASRSKDLAPHADPGSGPLSMPLAHVEESRQLAPTSVSPPGRKALVLSVRGCTS